MKTTVTLAALSLAVAVAPTKSAEPGTERMLVYIGTYTGGPSKGIYAFEFSSKAGTLRPLGLAAETPNPSFLAIHPSKKFLYAVNEVGSYQGKKSGSVTGFAINTADGKLTKINDSSTGGTGPCHISIDRSGKFALVANYGGGSVASLSIDGEGKLSGPVTFVQHTGSSINKQRQSEPHAHSINMDPRNTFALAADLGLDKILVYRLDARGGALQPNDPPFGSTPPGGGPRHLAFAPGGDTLFVNNEMTSSVTTYAYDQASGVLRQKGTVSTLPGEWKGNNSTAEIQVHPTGKFVYCSNRGHDSIAVFSADAEGRLKLLENESTRGKTPRNFTIDPTGRYLIAANQDSDTLAIFRIDPGQGLLEAVGEPVATPKPVCVKFLAL